MRSVLAFHLSSVRHCGMTCFDGAQGPCCWLSACRATEVWDYRLVPASKLARSFTVELRCRYCQTRKSAGDMTVVRTSSQARAAMAAFIEVFTSSSISTSSNRTSISSTAERSHTRDMTDHSESTWFRGFAKLCSQQDHANVYWLGPWHPVSAVLGGGSVPAFRETGTAGHAGGPANELCYALLSAGRCYADSDGLLPCSAAASRQLFRTACKGPPLCTAEMRPHRLCSEIDSPDQACNAAASMLHYAHSAIVAMQR